MNTKELLKYNLKHTLPVVSIYDNRYANVSLRQLEENAEKDAIVHYELANRYRQGIGGAEYSPAKAYDYYQKVLRLQKNVCAMYWLGHLCLFCLPHMKQDSLLYLEVADKLGHRDAPWLLGLIALDYPDIAPTDPEKAYKLFLRAKEQGNIKIIDRYLGICAERLHRDSDARRHYTDGFHRGDKACANYLGYMYYVGDGVKRDVDSAKGFFLAGQESENEGQAAYAKMMLSLIALDHGTPKEQYDAVVYLENNTTTDLINLPLGKAYLDGIPGYLKENETKALRFLENAAPHDRGEACYHIAYLYCCRMDKEKSNRYLLTSAKSGFAPARSLCMESNEVIFLHTQESLDELVKEYDDKYDKASTQTVIKAAETDPAAMYELASRYRLGTDGLERNFHEAAKWYRKVLWYQRNVRAMFYLGLYLDQVKEDSALALKYWMLAYSYGSADAAINIGAYYEGGNETVKQDLNKALQFYRFAKEHGRKDADMCIGATYVKTGQYGLAEKHLRSAIAADSSNMYPYFDMGVLFLKEDNPKQNEAEAIKWFREAEKRGHKEAREILNILIPKSKPKVEKNPSAEQLLKEVEQLERNPADTLTKRQALLTYAEKLYPNHPEVLRKWINASNFCYYLVKFFNKQDTKELEFAYQGFRQVLEKIERLRKITGMTAELNKEHSFAVTHLAELALKRGQDQYAWSLLEQADHNLTPIASVIAIMCLLKKLEELECAAKVSAWEKRNRRNTYYQQLKKEVKMLSVTVENASLWNNQNVERASGYYALYMCYRSKEYAPYLRHDPALAKKYLKKCSELNPEMVKGLI